MAFTVLNCGTNYHRGKDGELVAELGKNMDGREYRDFLINDGPGSKPPDAPWYDKKKYRPGHYDPFTRDRAKKQKASAFAGRKKRKEQTWSKTPMGTLDNFVTSDKEEEKRKAEILAFERQWLAKKGWQRSQLNPDQERQLGDASTKFSQRVFKPTGPTGTGLAVGLAGAGSVYGDGWDDNIRRTVATLGEVCLPDPSGTGYGGTGPAREIRATRTVNMVGWSRGAVTCIRIANWAKEFLGGGVRFNIFAVDPVAGLDAGLKLWDAQNVPDNVLNLVVILAADEKGANYRPQDKDRLKYKANTNVLFLPFPGIHGTPVQGANEVARLVKHLAGTFLTKFPPGDPSPFKHPPAHENPLDQLSLYADIQRRRPAYRQLYSWSLGGGSTEERSVSLDPQQYVSANASWSCFVNEHHRACLHDAFPAVERFLFSRQASARGQEQSFEDLWQRARGTADLMLRTIPGLRRTVDRTGVPQWQLPTPGIARSNLAPDRKAIALSRELVR